MLRLEEFGYEVTERGLPSPTSLAKNFARTAIASCSDKIPQCFAVVAPIAEQYPVLRDGHS